MLTHLPRDKMAAISQTIFFWCIFVNEKFCILITISLKFVPNGPVNANPALVEMIYLNQCWPDSIMHSLNAALGGDELRAWHQNKSFPPKINPIFLLFLGSRWVFAALKWVFVESNFLGWKQFFGFCAMIVFEFRWRLRIIDAETSSKFKHQPCWKSATLATPSANLQPREILFGELVKCNRVIDMMTK